MNFKIEKNEKYALIRVTVEKLDTHIAPLLKNNPPGQSKR